MNVLLYCFIGIWLWQKAFITVSMTGVLNDGEDVLAMVFRQENKEFCVSTARRTSDEEVRLRRKKLALRES